jgi:hypothetical protein
MQDICMLIKKGPYNGMYSLKPEFASGNVDLAKTVAKAESLGEAVQAGSSVEEEDDSGPDDSDEDEL